MQSLPVNWTAIAVMAAGGTPLAQISRQTGIALGTLKARSAREGWKRAGQAAQAQEVSNAVQANRISPVATDVVQVMANTLAEDGKATRASLSRAARRMAEQAETADLEQAGDALQVGKLAALAHDWGNKGTPAVRISMYAHAAEVQVESIEVDDGPVIDV